MKEIIIFGTGLIAEVAHFYFTHDSDYTVAAFTVDGSYLKEATFLGLPCIPFESIEKAFSPDQFSMFTALSYSQLNELRAQKYHEGKSKGYNFVNYVSSKATVWSKLNSQENCFILEDNTIQPFVKIGNNVTLWSGNHIGHHAEIGDNCFISSHVVVSGEVIIGKNCFIGVNATLRNNISIGNNCVIGAGALVMKNVDENSVYIQEATSASKISSQRLRNL